MKVFSYLLIISLLFTSCFSYRKTVSDPAAINLGKHYKFKFSDGSVKRKIMNYPANSLTVKYLFKRSKTFAITDAVEIKEGKFSILKSTGFALILATAALPILTVIALANLNLDIGGGMQFPN